MLSTNDIKYIRSLQQKKFRQKYNNFIVEGEKIVLEALSNATFEVEAVFMLEDWAVRHKPLLKKLADKCVLVTEKELGRISGLRSPNKVVLIAKQNSLAIKSPAPNEGLALYLDNIQDPGNLGTIFRIADWFGIPYVFCSPDCVELYNPKVLQAAMGAFLRVRIIHESFESTAERMNGLPICGTVLEGENIFKTSPPQKALVVIGNESHGISQGIMENITERWCIPPGPNSGAESLNAAIACGIICAFLRK